MFSSSLQSFVLCDIHVVLMLFVFIYWYLTLFLGNVRVVEQYTTCVINVVETATLPEHRSSPLVFSRVRVAQSLVSIVVFCRLLFVV